MPEHPKRAGYVALLGRPNVGKSTLLNRLLARKISITSAKPQTTRHAILGIRTLADAQVVYVDTPGLHLDTRRAIDRYLNRTASGVLAYVDVVVFVIEALRWQAEDQDVLQRLSAFTAPVILAVNKIDRLDKKSLLLPFLQEQAEKRTFAEIIPLSAKRADNVAVLERLITALLPEAEFLFAENQVTTASKRFIMAELVREKLINYLHKELPYSLTVEIESLIEREDLLRISAVIWVERRSQKRIVIGARGSMLKRIGLQAREEMEALFGRKVFLETWVKVREDWCNDERALYAFGYQEAF
jgi:GTP-binding protein Era